MTWTSLATVASGDTITAARTNTEKDNFNHLRTMTGGADPSVTGLALVSTGTATTDWAKVTSSHLGTLSSLQFATAAGVKLNLYSTGFGIGINSSEITLFASAGSVVRLRQDTYNGTILGTFWHSGNDGAGSGLDADTVDSKNPTATPGAGALPLADGSGTLDSWITSTKFVPSGLIAGFETAAGIAAGWSRYTAADGRFLIGAGTTGTQTFVEASSNGTTWTHNHGATGLTTSEATAGSVNSGGGSTATPAHSHTVGGNTADTEFVPPVRVIVFARKT